MEKTGQVFESKGFTFCTTMVGQGEQHVSYLERKEVWVGVDDVAVRMLASGGSCLQVLGWRILYSTSLQHSASG